MRSLLRAFLQSWQHLARQAWVWLATLAVFIMAFAAVNALISAQALATQLLVEARSRVDVAVSFLPSTPPAVVEQARTYVSGLPQVATVQVISADQALEAFRTRYKDDQAVRKALEEVGRNPLGATLIVQGKELGQYEAIVEALRAPAYKEWIQESSLSDHGKAIAELEQLQRAVQLVGSLLLVFFACIALLLVFNAVRLVIFTQRDEIAIMRLVGAPKWRIRLPFVLSVLWVTAGAWLLVIGASAAAYTWLFPQTTGWMRSGLLAMHQLFTQGGALLLAAEGALAAVLSMLVAWIASGKYVKR